MKKIVTLFCALALVMSASARNLEMARSIAPNVQSHVVLKGDAQKQHLAQAVKNLNLSQLPTSLNLPSEVKPQLNRMKSAIMGDSIPFEADTVACAYYGSLYYYIYGQAVHSWDLAFLDQNGNIMTVKLVTSSGTSIAGEYDLAEEMDASEVIIDGDTIEAVGGHANITYVGEGPLYNFDIAINDADGNVFYFNGNIVPFAIDFLYALYGYEEEAIIELDDAPFIPGDTIQVAISDAGSAKYYSEYGDYQLIAGDPAQYYVSLDIYTEEGALEGNWETEDFDNYYTYIGYVRGGDTIIVDMKVCNAAITKSGNTYNVDAYFGAKDGTVYHITFSFVIDNSLEYDSKAGNVTDAFVATDSIIVENYIAQYGDVMIELMKADGSALMILDFYTDAYDSITGVPAGTYPIDDVEAAGHAVASTGIYQVSGSSYITPCYYSTLDEEGYLNIDSIYMMVSGTVKVEALNDGMKITVAAKNSNDYNVNVTYVGKMPTGIKEIVAETKNNGGVKKVMNGNQLMIIREGKVFNALGAEIQ